MDSLSRASQGSSTASQASFAGSGMVVEGVSSLVLVGGELVVDAVKTVGEKSVLVLRNVADGSRVSVQITGEVIGATSMAIGTTVVVVATATGSLLSAAGQAIAFIPNEVGKSLLFHARH